MYELYTNLLPKRNFESDNLNVKKTQKFLYPDWSISYFTRRVNCKLNFIDTAHLVNFPSNCPIFKR